MAEIIKRRKRLTPFQMILLGFMGVIVIGALLLMLPIASKDGSVTPFNQTLFTATSAVCVTGLVVQDTATHWSVFGQAVILLLIQIGGLGVATTAAMIAFVSGKKISFGQRITMQSAISAPNVGGIVKMTRFIIIGTAIVELIGAIAMMPVFISDYGLKGIWMSFFHSISAFCNAGFDIMGQPDNKFVSVTAYADNPLINIVIMTLIIVGGIGFITWKDVFDHKFKFNRYRLQSKIVITSTAVLIIVPALLFFLHDFAKLPLSQRIFGSLFQSVTTRTAGFNTLDLNSLSTISRTVFIFLMLVGGSPGSTAGGMKITTISVLFYNAISGFRRKQDPECFGRRIGSSVVKTASTVFAMYIALCFIGAAIICFVENLPFGTCLFESASAVGTVGLTLGITPKLSLISQMILVALMFLGRVGGLNVIYAAYNSPVKNVSKLPEENVIVG